ncbi:MAG: ATP-binding protein [Thermotogota bacterium]
MNELKQQTATLVFPVQEVFVQAALDFVHTMVSISGFEKKIQTHIRLALEEMLNYLSTTALSDPEAEPLSLSMSPQEEGLLIRLTVKGLPLDLEHLPSFSFSEELDEKESQGLNLHLVRAMMDDLSFINRGREGLEITMTKTRTDRHVEHLIEEKEVPTAPAQDPDQPLLYTVRAAMESDAFQISRGAYLSYGYTYYDFVYYPEQIINLQRSGRLHSLVFVKDDDGQVIGHAAVKMPPNRTDIGEQGVWFIIPEYRRSYGLAPILGQESHNLARKLGLNSTYAQMLAGHIKSQKMGLALGLKDCTLLLGYKPRDTNVKGLGGKFQGKMGVLTQWSALKPQRSRSIYPPERYRDFVQTLYEHLEIPYVIASQGTIPESETRDPVVEVTRDGLRNIGQINVSHIGSDPAGVSKWCLNTCRDLAREKLDVIYLRLNLEDSGASELAQKCAKEGFIIAGIFPDEFVNGDALVMQYMNLPENPFEGLKLASDMANSMLQTIQEDFGK